jgi:hypothetical protein
LAEDEKKALEKEIKSNAEYVRDAVEEISNFKKQLDGLNKAPGATQESLIKAIELIIRAFGASKEAYHEGVYNGVSVLLIIQNAKYICQQIMTLLMEKSKTNGAEREHIHNKVNCFERVIGYIDDFFVKLAIINPTDEERFQACEACGAMIHEWRSQEGFGVPIKAHICEDHMYDLNE